MYVDILNEEKDKRIEDIGIRTQYKKHTYFKTSLISSQNNY